MLLHRTQLFATPPHDPTVIPTQFGLALQADLQYSKDLSVRSFQSPSQLPLQY
jgi:hypothetical protein